MKFLTDKLYLIITILKLIFLKIKNLCMLVINLLYFISTKLIWQISHLLSLAFYIIFQSIFIFIINLIHFILIIPRFISWLLLFIFTWIVKITYVIVVLFIQSFYTIKSFVVLVFNFIYESILVFVELIYTIVSIFYNNFNHSISLYQLVNFLFKQIFILLKYIGNNIISITKILVYILIYIVFVKSGLLRIFQCIVYFIKLILNSILLIIQFLIRNILILFKTIVSFLDSIIMLLKISLKTLLGIFFNIFKILFWKNIFYNIYYFVVLIIKMLYSLVRFFLSESFIFVRFLPNFLKNLITFIGEDLLKLKKVFNWSITHIFRFLAISTAGLIIIISFITFYKNKDTLNDTIMPEWQDIKGFIDINKLLQKALNSDVFKPVVFYNVSLTLPEGANIFNLLMNEGISSVDANNVIDSINHLYNIRSIKPGWTVNITIAKSRDWLYSKVQKLSIPVNNTYDLITEADNNYDYTTYKKPKKLTRYLIRRRVLVQDSIYKSTISAGVPDSITTEILKVLSWDVDFQREIRSNDKLDIVFECLYNQNDELVTCDNILYVSLKGSVKSTYFYKYDGVYYHEDGRTVAKTLVKTPINNARLSSSFGIRNHPVLGYTLLHKGVDFAAPIGTPIYASGDGIIQIRQLSTTYGNFIRIKHNDHLSSLYAHMVAFAPGLKVGSRVKQWQVIGYVGRTGRVTGPHLHYEVIINGRQVNPLTIQMSSEKRLSGEELKNFEFQRIDFDNLIIKIPLRGKIVSPIDEINKEGGITNIAFNGRIIDKK